MMRHVCIAFLLLLAPLASAATGSTGTVHAFLDRTHVSLGDTVTLNIQSGGTLDTPDLSPLQNDFQVLGTSRSSSVQITNGKTETTSQLGIALKPLHDGTLTIPPLDVGSTKTPPLTLQVGAAPAGGVGKLGDPVFMEASVLSSSPWVGQQTVYTVRLFYLPGVDGALGDPSADGARLIKLDRDHRYMANRNGYAYRVIERSWALIPQRSGAITVQGPVFQGQRLAVGSPGTWFNNPNALLNNPNAILNGQMPGLGAPVQATAPSVHVNARAAPAGAGKPWLPARTLQLEMTGLPSNGEVDAGTPLTLTLSISASGQPADALPEPELPPIAGAQTYPDQTQDSTDDSGQWLQGKRTRSFAIVPQRNGSLTIPAITLNWWNVETGRAEQASVPAHTLRVTGAVANAASVPAPPAASVVTGNSTVVPAVKEAASTSGVPDFWRIVALASLALWLLAILIFAAWLWRQRRSARQAPRARKVDRGMPVKASDTPVPDPAATVSATRPDARTLQRHALDAARVGDAAACEHALLEWARASRTGITHLSQVRDALSDPAQCEALEALQRARWQGGDSSLACGAVADAFARGFAWHRDGRPAPDRGADLPPLYPSR
jgi:HAMP domain-containing protein